MTQRDRDRLVALKKAKKGLITQRQAAEEIGQSERNVRRLLRKLASKGGDAALVHGLRETAGPTARVERQEQAGGGQVPARRFVSPASAPPWPAEYSSGIAPRHSSVSRETVRAWMVEAKL